MPRTRLCLTLVGVAGLLSACVPGPDPEARGVAAANQLEALALPSTARVTVAGNTYAGEANADRTEAIATPLSGLQHSIDRIETAAAAQTGCAARASDDVYALMRGRASVQIPTNRLQAIGGQVPVDLTC